MNNYRKELDKLYSELDYARQADEEGVCISFNVDRRQEAIQAIQDEIKVYESWLSEEESSCDYEDDHELIRERDTLCMSLGISRYC